MWVLESSMDITDVQVKEMSVHLESLLARKDVGFHNLEVINDSIKASKKIQNKVSSCNKMIIIGLGGSSLGSKALADALLGEPKDTEIVFLDNVDAYSLKQKLDGIESIDKCFWSVISKSGGTIEVLSLLDHCHNYFLNKNDFDICNQMVVITEEKPSPLYDFAKSKRIDTLPVPLNVGGRFSILTSVGFFPMLAMNVSVDDLQKGAEKVLEDKELVLKLSSLLFESLKREEFQFYSFQYCDRLISWGDWLQQLWSESLGKALDNEGKGAPLVSTLIPCRGASDQHSVLQQVMEGRKKKIVGFLRVESSESGSAAISKSLVDNELMLGKSIGQLLAAEAGATEKALNDVEIPTFCLKTDELTAQTMGYLVMLWMLSVGCLGEALNINAFDQPGVESGKRLARRVLTESH